MAIFRHQKHTLTFQFTQALTYLNIQTHKYTYTDSHTYIDTPSLTPSAHVLGQAGESSMYLLPKSAVQIVLDSPTFWQAELARKQMTG